MQSRLKLALMLFGVLLAAITPAEAQVTKCVGPEGKVTYTDGVCQQGQSGTGVNTRPNTADQSSLRRSTQSEITTGNRSTGVRPPVPAPAAESSMMSPSEKANRVRSLQMDIDASNATWEKRSAAQAELARLDSNSRMLTADEEQRLRNARAGLDGADRRARERALDEVRRALREIYGY